MEKPEKKDKVTLEQHHQFCPEVWTQSYLQRIDTSNKALHKGLFDGKQNKPKQAKFNSRWDELPDLLLEEIFSYLTIREKYYASMVCKHWYDAFHLPYVWSEFVVGDSTLTRARFNYYQGWEYVLDHVRTQMCLTQVGMNFRRLTFEPMLNFFNWYEFMNMMSWYCEQGRMSSSVMKNNSVAKNIKSLKFTFPCNMNLDRDDDQRNKLIGTGGKLLGALKRLMFNLKNMQKLELVDLMLDTYEAQYLLDDVCDICCLSMRTLILINTTTLQYPLLHVSVFLNLEVLVISPQNLGEDVVELLGSTQLKHLHIYQNRYTPSENIFLPISSRAWKICRTNNPVLSVHLELETINEKQMIWQDNAPVKTVLYNSQNIGVQLSSIMTIIELYKNDLKIYGHKNIPRGYRAKSFHDRIDEPLILLCRSCKNIEILVITERISTSTLLLIAETCRFIKHIYVRRNAVIKKCDWERNPDWSMEFYEWLKINSRSYESVEREISQMVGYKWTMVSDKNFKKLYVNLHD